MKHKTMNLFGVLLLLTVFGLRLLSIIVGDGTRDDSFDPDKIDIGPAIQAHIEAEQKKRTDTIMAQIDRQLETAKKHGRELRARWTEARQAGLVGETGVLYVPSKHKLAYDGTPNEFAAAQSTPPKSGWYVIMKRTRASSGDIKASLSSAGSGPENPAATNSKRGTQIVR